MVLKLYFDYLSQPSRALYIYLKVCNIPFEPHVVTIAKGEHQTEEYQQVHPFGKVPAIDHDGYKLVESIAIVRYIARTFKIPDHWYPSSTREQARVDEYLEWQHLNTRMYCSRYFLASTIFPMMRQRPANPNTVTECRGNMIKCLNDVENKWLKDDKPFLIGDKISVADIFAACEIEQPRMSGFDARQGRPKLTQWLNRVADTAAPHYADAHRYLDIIAVKLAGRLAHTCSISDIMDLEQ